MLPPQEESDTAMRDPDVGGSQGEEDGVRRVIFNGILLFIRG